MVSHAFIFSSLIIVSTLNGVAKLSAKPNTFPRVVTISQDGLQKTTGSERFEATMTRLEQAGSFHPDIACLPETFTLAKAESIPGPTTNRLSKWAKANKSYVICPIKVESEGIVYNSALLIDRKGKIVGRYDKIHPTENELEESICPGAVNPQVFKTDFGTIGIQICFDVNWGAQWQRLKEAGADIIFFPSAYPADRQLTAHAWINQIYVVSSTLTKSASIYDISGEKLSTSGPYQHWASAVLPLGKRIFEIDYHVKKMREIQKKYGPKVELTWYHNDDLCSLASLDPDLSVEDIIEEFELTPHRDYIQRAQKAQNDKRIAVTAN